MNVVTSAIRTIIENRAGEMIGRSSPMLRITSSIQPRALTSVPTVSDSRHGKPRARTAKAHPNNFAEIAAAIMARQ